MSPSGTTALRIVENCPWLRSVVDELRLGRAGGFSNRPRSCFAGPKALVACQDAGLVRVGHETETAPRARGRCVGESLTANGLFSAGRIQTAAATSAMVLSFFLMMCSTRRLRAISRPALTAAAHDSWTFEAREFP